MKKKASPSPRKLKPSALQAKEHKQRSLTGVKTPAVIDAAGLLSDLRSLIQSARHRIATVSYSTQTLLCWHVGRRLLTENLQGSRAAYGKQILVTVSRELTAEYGRGFSYAELARMIQFADLFPDEEIVVTLSQLGSGFAFVARQKRMSVGKDDFHLVCSSSTAACAG